MPDAIIQQASIELCFDNEWDHDSELDKLQLLVTKLTRTIEREISTSRIDDANTPPISDIQIDLGEVEFSNYTYELNERLVARIRKALYQYIPADTEKREST